MENQNQILEGYSDLEKGAYLGAIASVATADNNAGPEEIEALETLAEAAGLSDEQKAAVVSAAKEPSQVSLPKCLEVLKGSELRFAFMADVLSFAKADGTYSAEEDQKIKEIAAELGVNNEQVQALNQVAAQVNQTAAAANGLSANSLFGMGGSTPQDGQASAGGIGGLLQKVGIPNNALSKGLLAMMIPVLLSKVMGGGRRSGGGGLLGGLLGGAMGGMMGGGMGNSMPSTGGGGLGSLIGVLMGKKQQPATAGAPAPAAKRGGIGSLISDILKGRNSGF